MAEKHHINLLSLWKEEVMEDSFIYIRANPGRKITPPLTRVVTSVIAISKMKRDCLNLIII